jgi:hypothetical protein
MEIALEFNEAAFRHGISDDDTINVFHAMKARRTFLAQIGL